MANGNMSITQQLGKFFTTTDLYLSLNDHTLRYLRSLTQAQVITMHRLIKDCPVLSTGINNQIVEDYMKKKRLSYEDARKELDKKHKEGLESRHQKEMQKKTKKRASVSGGSSKQPQKKAKTDEQAVVQPVDQPVDQAVVQPEQQDPIGDDGEDSEQDQMGSSDPAPPPEQNIQGDCTESDNDEDQMGPTSDDGKDGEQGQRATTGGKCMRYVLENSGDGEKVDSDNEDDNTHDSYSQVFNERDARAMVMNNTNADNENADTGAADTENDDDIPINSTMVVDMDHIEAMEVERALVMPAERAAHDDASELTTSNSAFQVREPPAQALNGASGANRPHVIVIDDD